jgi:hypothetical protein
VIQAFYSSDNIDNIDRLIKDLAVKITDYLEMVFEMKLMPEESIPPEGIISFFFGSGYWMNLSKQWYDYMISLYSIDIGAMFIPWRPGRGNGFRGFYFKTGLGITFFHGINQPGYEGSNLLSFIIGIPLMLCTDIGIRHTIGAVLEPQFLIDYLIRERLYDDTTGTVSLLFSTAVDLEYQFHFSESLSLGLKNSICFHFIDPLRIAYNPVIFIEYNLKPLFGGGMTDEK